MAQEVSQRVSGGSFPGFLIGALSPPARYFILENGVLIYGKTPSDIARGRSHGRIDVGSCVISAKTEMCRIDIDDEEGLLHHIRVSNSKDFGLWLEQLKQHRLFQQHQVRPLSVNSILLPRRTKTP